MKNRNNVDVPSKYGLFVNGEFAEAASGETFEVVNPASGEKIADVARARRFSDLVSTRLVFLQPRSGVPMCRPVLHAFGPSSVRTTARRC
jgi:hypothetical protein